MDINSCHFDNGLILTEAVGTGVVLIGRLGLKRGPGNREVKGIGREKKLNKRNRIGNGVRKRKLREKKR